MPVLESYLFFNGKCAEAMRFYERTLGGKLERVMTYGEGPGCDQMAPEARELVMHARLVLDDRTLMASDCPPDRPYEGMKGFSLSLVYPTAADAQRIFDALADGGQVIMPLQKTFWAEAFGMTTDRFGTPWMVNGGMAPL